MAVVVAAEDDPDNLLLIVRLLERAGHTVIAVGDGVSALAATRRHKPDLVVTDQVMPGMTGLTVCEELRADAATRTIPVVLATGSLGDDDLPRGIANVDGCVVKPFRAGELARVVEKVLAARTSSPVISLPEPYLPEGEEAS